VVPFAVGAGGVRVTLLLLLFLLVPTDEAKWRAGQARVQERIVYLVELVGRQGRSLNKANVYVHADTGATLPDRKFTPPPASSSECNTRN